MGAWGWIVRNWFTLLSAVGVAGGLWFTGLSMRSDNETRRIANLIAMTRNHRELWRDFYRDPDLARVLDRSADLARAPVTRAEAEFVNTAIQHLSTVYRAMRSDLAVEPEGLRKDVVEFFSLPIPRSVWETAKPLQDSRLVLFVEDCLVSQDLNQPKAAAWARCAQ